MIYYMYAYIYIYIYAYVHGITLHDMKTSELTRVTYARGSYLHLSGLHVIWQRLLGSIPRLVKALKWRSTPFSWDFS